MRKKMRMKIIVKNFEEEFLNLWNNVPDSRERAEKIAQVWAKDKDIYDLQAYHDTLALRTIDKYRNLVNEKNNWAYVMTMYDEWGHYVGVKVRKTERTLNDRSKQIETDNKRNFVTKVALMYACSFESVDDMYAMECLLHKWIRRFNLKQIGSDYFLGNEFPSDADYDKLDSIAEQLKNLI